MGYEQTYFGDGSGAGTGNVTDVVNNHYGPRDTGKTQGRSRTSGFKKELVIDIDGTMVGNAAYPLDAPSLPAGAVITEVFADVSKAFVLGGTTPALEIGTETSEATNGFTVTEAQAEAVATYDLTSALSGTWAAPLAAATTVGLALSGTSPTVTPAGKMRVVITYIVS